MKKIDFGSDEEFIKNYQKLKSSRKMGELYGCTKGAVLNHAKAINYDNSKNKEIKLPLEKKEEIIMNYEKLKSLEKVGEIYNCSSTSVRNFFIKIDYDYTKVEHKSLKNVDTETFIELYESLGSAQKVGEALGFSSTAILNHAHNIGYDIESSKNYFLTEENKKYITDHYYDKTSGEIAKELNISRGLVTKTWYDYNLQGKKIINSKTTEIDIKGQKFGKWTVLYKTEKRNSSGIIQWHCKCECGIERDVLGNSLRGGYSLSCGAHYNNSRGNEKIKNILLDNNIPFEIEKKFSSCKDIKELPFDFYVKSSYLIEFDGIQHYKEDSLFDYEYTHKHDLIKNKWCKDNNIPLIRIPQYHFDNLTLEDLLLESSKFIVK